MTRAFRLIILPLFVGLCVPVMVWQRRAQAISPSAVLPVTLPATTATAIPESRAKMGQVQAFL